VISRVVEEVRDHLPASVGGTTGSADSGMSEGGSDSGNEGGTTPAL